MNAQLCEILQSFLSIEAFIPSSTIPGFVGTSGNAKGMPPHLHFGVYTTEGVVISLLFK